MKFPILSKNDPDSKMIFLDGFLKILKKTVFILPIKILN